MPNDMGYGSSAKKKATPRKRTVSNAGPTARRKNRPLTPEEKRIKRMMEQRARIQKKSKEFRMSKSTDKVNQGKRKKLGSR